MNYFVKSLSAFSKAVSRYNTSTKWLMKRMQVIFSVISSVNFSSQIPTDTREGAKNVFKASTHTSSNIGIGVAVGGAIGAGVGTMLGPVGIAAIGSATAVVGGAIAKGVNVLKQRMVQREAKKAGLKLDED